MKYNKKLHSIVKILSIVPENSEEILENNSNDENSSEELE